MGFVASINLRCVRNYTCSSFRVRDTKVFFFNDMCFQYLLMPMIDFYRSNDEHLDDQL